jgi:ComF family protein
MARCLDALLPSRCLLCGAGAPRGRDLCDGCLADFPRNRTCCARCAQPLAASAALCGACLRREPAYACAWAPYQYAHPLNLLEARFKFRRDLSAGRVLADLLVDAARTRWSQDRPERLLCVPLHPTRLRERGYNQALELARTLSRALDIPLAHDLLVRVRATRAQTGLDAKARRRNLRGAFACPVHAGVPAHVAIVDDVMTTGSTVDECARVLRQAGVARVDVWALARAPGRR